MLANHLKKLYAKNIVSQESLSKTLKLWEIVITILKVLFLRNKIL